MKFSELSDKAKARVRNEHRYYEVHDDWWDYTYEDAQRMGLLLGIEIDDRRFKTLGGGTSTSPNISFDDHDVSFTGKYTFVSGAADKVKTETNDAELLRIAEALTAIQVSVKLLHGFTHECEISSECQFDQFDGPDDPFDDGDYSASQKEIDQLVRVDFAAWIKKQLDAEEEWLTSDECLDNRLSDDDIEYDEDGNTI
jgi:hypothetical protein